MTTQCISCSYGQVITDSTLNRTLTEADCGKTIVKLQPTECPNGILDFSFVPRFMTVEKLREEVGVIMSVAGDKFVFKTKFFSVGAKLSNDGKWAILSEVEEYLQKGGKVEKVVQKCLACSGLPKTSFPVPEIGHGRESTSFLKWH